MRVALKTGLLLGNGINARIGIKDLTADKVAGRFEELMRECISPMCKEFEIDYADDFVVDISGNTGIEHLVEALYEYIKTKKPGHWIKNDDIDLDSITGTSDMKKIRDLKGNPLLLFVNSWSVGMVLDRNPGLVLSEFGRNE